MPSSGPFGQIKSSFFLLFLKNFLSSNFVFSDENEMFGEGAPMPRHKIREFFLFHFGVAESYNFGPVRILRVF